MRQDRISDALLPAAGSTGAKLGQALLWQPSFVRDDKLLWHVPFLFWLLETTQPRQYVEVGVGDGVGYMAVCQAFHKMRTHARCYAVGEWTNGDGQSSVPEPLASRNADLYGDFSEILSEGIDKSAAAIEDCSVDLMLVDLTTAPQAAASLHPCWIPKLSPKGILLINGIDRNNEATAILVNGLAANSPTVRMPGGDGLLVVLPSRGFEDEFSKLTALSPEDPAQKLIVAMFTRLGAGTYFEANAKDKDDRIRALDEKTKELWKQRDKLAGQLRELREQYESRHRKVAMLQSHEFDLQTALASTVADRDRMRSALSKAQSEKEDSQFLIERERTARSEADKKLRQAVAETQWRASRIEELQKSCRELAKLFDQEQTASSHAQARYREAIDLLEMERSARINADDEKNQAVAEIEMLRRRITELILEAQQSHQANRCLIENAEEGENIIAALTEELRLLREQIRACLIGPS